MIVHQLVFFCKVYFCKWQKQAVFLVQLLVTCLLHNFVKWRGFNIQTRFKKPFWQCSVCLNIVPDRKTNYLVFISFRVLKHSYALYLIFFLMIENIFISNLNIANWFLFAICVWIYWWEIILSTKVMHIYI